MSDFKIIGSTDPIVGKEEFYSVNTFLPSVLPFQNTASNNSFEQPVKWEIYILENGRWRKTKENDKTGKRISYTFLQKSLERKGIRILARRGEDIARLNVTTHPAEQPKIESIELLDKSGKKTTKPLSYGQTLKARVHCLHMEKHKVSVTLWEDDADGAGHNKANEKNIIQTLSAVVKNGIAEVDFLLRPSFAKIARQNGTEEGKVHEYYVTTDFNKDKIASNNVNVNDLETPVAPFKGKVPVQQQAPAKPKASLPQPAQPKAKTPATGSSAPKAKAEITNVHFTDTAGRAITGVFKENQIKVWIDSTGLIGKEIRLKLYDEDGISDDLLFDEKFTIKSNIYAVVVPLNQIPRSKGGGYWGEGAEQEVYAYVEVIQTGKYKECKAVDVDATVFKPDPVDSTNKIAKVGEGDKNEGENGKKSSCDNCIADVTARQLQPIFPDADFDVLEKAAKTYTKYMKEFGMNTCWNKAHFFAQASIEVGKSFALKSGEILNYSTKRLIEGDYSSGFVKGNLATKKGGYYTTGEFHKRPFSYFDSHRDEAEKYGRKDLNKNNDKLIQKADSTMIANLAYGPNSAKGKELGNTNEGDGNRFIGRGLIQLTGRTNYTDVEPYIKKNFPTLDILTDKDVKNVGTNVEIAVLSSMAYWSGTKRKINKVSNGQENVDKVSRLIGSDVDWKGKAKSFKEVTSQKFKTKECKWGKVAPNGRIEKGTIVVVAGKSSKLGDVKSGNKQWPVYKTTVYQNMSLNTFNKLEKDNKLPSPDYTTFLTRDAHSLSVTGRSSKRYGSSNEAPPGTYYLSKGSKSQKYHIYLGDEEGGCSISGTDGWRGGIAIHGGFPAGTEGCLTTHMPNYGNRKKKQEINSKVKELIDNIPDFDDNTDDRPVRLILKERQATKEGNLWYGKVE